MRRPCFCAPDPIGQCSNCAEWEAEQEAADRAAAFAEDASPCADCGDSGVEMYVGRENSVNERPCSTCQPSSEELPFGPILAGPPDGRD